MKSSITGLHWLIVAGLLMGLFSALTAFSSTEGSLGAAVDSLQGIVEMPRPGEVEPMALRKGDGVNPWESVKTGQQSKVLLRWAGDVWASLGEASAVFLSYTEGARGKAPDIQIIEGIARATSAVNSGSPAAPYSVTTPLVSVEPEEPGRPTDFIVEVYDAATTVISVIEGRVIVRDIPGESSRSWTVPQCSAVYVKQGAKDFDLYKVGADSLEKLVEATTVPGTLVARTIACEPAREPVRSVERITEKTVQYVDVCSIADPYPYHGYRVLPPRAAGGPIVIIIPGCGRWVIPYSYYQAWHAGPDFVEVIVRQVFLDRVMHHDRFYMAEMQARRMELERAAYLASAAGNFGLLQSSRREMDDLRLRQGWLQTRMGRYEAETARLKGKSHGFPGGTNSATGLYKGISSALLTHENAGAQADFQRHIKKQVELQSQFAGVVGGRVGEIRADMAAAKSPQERLAFRKNLDEVMTQLSAGKAFIPEKDRKLGSLVSKLAAEKDPERAEKLRDELRTDMGRLPVRRDRDHVGSEQLVKLTGGLSRVADPAKRMDFEKQAKELQESIQKRK
ncbi:MAG: hypothetical protein V2B18_19025, partial [Pseudomonadota bacterium]